MGCCDKIGCLELLLIFVLAIDISPLHFIVAYRAHSIELANPHNLTTP